MNDAPETSTPDAPSEVEKLRSRVAELELRLAPGAAAPVDALGGAAWTSLVIFGADGNLATKKTYLTLFALWRKRLLPPDVVILGTPLTSADDFRKRVYRAIYDSAHAQRERASFLERCAYVAGQFDDAAHLGALLREDEAYRIDHYLGKELVMNVLVLRFANALVAMEQPLSFGAADVKREKVKFDGYADDPSVADKATTTRRRPLLYIDNPRWAGVPFVLSAGKALEEKKVEVIRVQPDECIYWRVMNRVPGLHTSLKLEPRRMNLLYTPSESRDMPVAYERLLLEALRCVEINHWLGAAGHAERDGEEAEEDEDARDAAGHDAAVALLLELDDAVRVHAADDDAAAGRAAVDVLALAPAGGAQGPP
ncbi:glucose-6-phosphate dehydrogenase [Aureococcus anophagefferens]|nr:glucose-6-phosphate dehydrogenase [Aureococcus anophagefferens]